MTIYIDSDYKCHVNDDGTRRAVETDFFDGRCAEFVEGYKYDDSKGYVSIYPWEKYSGLAAIQSAVDRTQAQADEEIAALIEEIYINDMEVIENV